MRERFRGKSTKGFQLPRGECVPYNLANLLLGAAVVAGCVDGTLLAGVEAWSCVGLASCVHCIVDAAIIREKAVICCFGLSLGVNGS